ncbi:NAD-dependent epimerase/dehydratase family protein [Halobellus sp. Atlit-31R]|nr:NAD-dependent epimerase/dehydratase family protein [Halobellus sp. Atlit-31R]
MDKQIAITGGAGFLGSHVVDYLVNEGEDVVVIDDFSSGSRANLSQSLVKPNCAVRNTDLTKREDAIGAFEDIDVIIHLAAKIGGIGYFHDVPADIIALNDAMTRNVCDAAVEHDIDRLVYASSSMVYERATEFPVHEKQIGEIPPPDSAYGYQKLSGEYYCEAYHNQYDLEYAIFRPFNAVGPREPPGDEVGQAHVIPDFVLKILEEEQYPLKILGDGHQIRAFTHVSDIAAGIHACVYEDAAQNNDFNLGSSEGIEMRELARKIWDRCDRDREIKFETEAEFEHDVQKRVPDSSKAKERLNWEPEVSLDDALTEYIDWYREEVL